MMGIYYENSQGKKIYFESAPYRLAEYDGDSYELDFDITESQFGSKINRFKKGVQKKKMVLVIMSATKEEQYQALDSFYEITDYDVVNETAGKLWKNGQYMECYFISADNNPSWRTPTFMEKGVVFVAENPSWIIETKFEYLIESTSAGGFDYPHDYPFDYASSVRNDIVTNTHYVDCDFIMRIYGAVTNPYVYIGGHLYQVTVTLYDGDYLDIDSKRGTILLHKSNGEIVNHFNSRNKQSDTFKKIPVGNSFVVWSGLFGFDIFLKTERSEPKWTLS